MSDNHPKNWQELENDDRVDFLACDFIGFTKVVAKGKKLTYEDQKGETREGWNPFESLEALRDVLNEIAMRRCTVDIESKLVGDAAKFDIVLSNGADIHVEARGDDFAEAVCRCVFMAYKR